MSSSGEDLITTDGPWTCAKCGESGIPYEGDGTLSEHYDEKHPDWRQVDTGSEQ